MNTTVPYRSNMLFLVVILAVAAFACGGDDDDNSGTAEDQPTAASATENPSDAPEEGLVEEEAEQAVGASLAAAAQCLDELGFNTAAGDESSTGLTPDMMEGLGISEILTFDKGAGWGGTIESYASSAQADVAEDGYAGSPLGYEVDRVDDIVFKTTGPAEDLSEIAGCLTS